MGDTYGMEEIPESQEVIDALTTRFMRLYEAAEESGTITAEQTFTSEAEEYLEAVDSLIALSQLRVYRICLTLAQRFVDPILSNASGRLSSDSHISIGFLHEDDPEDWESAVQDFLSAVLRGDVGESSEIFIQLLNESDESFNDVRQFIDTLLLFALNASNTIVIDGEDTAS